MTSFLGIDIFETLISTAVVLVATVLHEVAHAATANALGDPTAKERGRLTLNPLVHLDPVGSVLLPLLMSLAGGPIFAFAKPVPYNPKRLRHPVRDEVLVALAGPACNLAQAIVGSIVFRVLTGVFGTRFIPSDPVYVVLEVLWLYVYINLMLMFFNLIPLPPLDGSAIISPLLKGEARTKYYRVQRYSMPILIAVLFLVPTVLHVNPLGTYIGATAGNLAPLMLGIR